MEPMCLFLCGDVMTGRGIDQILLHPVTPVLYEPWVRDARDYVDLAERVSGTIVRPVGFSYVWGDVLDELERAGTDARIVNLETSITCADEAYPKGINYRMHPRNVGCITAAGIDCCSLANNHTLDWGTEGLIETIHTLRQAGVCQAGAGMNAAEAAAPAVLDIGRKGRVLVFAAGSVTGGIPWEWAATAARPGVNLLEDLSEETAGRLAGNIRRLKQARDVAVVSIHWGGNWGYEIPDAQIRFAHGLIDGGVDLVHGHSSHHVKAIEVYRHRLILYGCGDFLTDYEGISGHEAFRGDLGLMYLPRLDPEGRLEQLRMVPVYARRLRLTRVPAHDARWLCDLLNRLGAAFGTRTHLAGDNSIALKLD